MLTSGNRKIASQGPTWVAGVRHMWTADSTLAVSAFAVVTLAERAA